MPRKSAQRMQEGGMPDYDEYGQTDGLLADDDFQDDPDTMDYSDPESPDYGEYSEEPAGADYVDGGESEDMSSQANAMLGSKRATAIKQLNDARDKIMTAMRPKTDDRAMWLSIAQGLLSPTRTGSFGESVGNAAGAAAPYMDRNAQQQAQWDDKIANMDYDFASSQYKDAMKDPKYQWVVGKNGRKQQAVNIDGQLYPIGRELAGTTGGQSLEQKIETYSKATGLPKEVVAKRLLEGKAAANITVQNNAGKAFETQNAKNGADAYKDLMAQVTASRTLSTKLNMMKDAIEKTPDAYFGPAGPGLVVAAQAFNQMGFDVGDGLDQAEFIQGLASNLGPAQRIVGSGSSSDKDVALFMSAIPSLTKSKEGNLVLIKYYGKLADYNRRLGKIMKEAQDRGDFYGVDDLTAEQIDAAGKFLTSPDEAAEITRAAEEANKTPDAPSVDTPGAAKTGLNYQTNPDGTIVINPPKAP